MTLWLSRHLIWQIVNKNEHISTNIHPYIYILKDILDNDNHTQQNEIIFCGYLSYLSS